MWTQIFFYATTTLIAVAAGIIGGIKYRRFRLGREFISITLEASSRPCSDGRIQIGVTAKMHNGSKVLAKATTLEWECRALGTYDDDAIATKLDEYFNSAGGNARQESGHTISVERAAAHYQTQRIIKRGLNAQIEPNETSHDNVTFVVPSYCTSVQVRLSIAASKDGNLIWTAVVYHDIDTPTPEAP